ncbi:putative geranylgeranyl pyrophosphate synthase 7, chloroplastic [Iris pallida]|uniref:Geranylgeranyl pyrophosphate synthase 7, chloroplastic n=1 Tax=Iris pallida TaxID=29817 RepID=A0AAX6HD83_IRIPA|nr:putative geranylgeranyl pyrophosphate synthase 7, chloroplastic [Iris pallida]
MAYIATSLPPSLLPLKTSLARPRRLPASAAAAARSEEYFSLREYMSAKVERVNKALDEAVPLRPPQKIHEAMRYSLLAPAKRVIPVLAIASCEAVGGEEALAIPPACAVEMVIAMSFIHDDLPCMDDDDVRRGQPSNHRAFGEHTALLSGCALLSLAFQHVAERAAPLVPAERVVRMVAELGRAFGSEGMLGGQLVDKESEGKADVGLEELKYIHECKSATFFEAAAVCGAIAGGGGEEEVGRLRKYARRVGLSYQVMDDVLDVTSTSEELGKTAGKDVASDKAAYPKLMGVEGAREFAAELAERAVEELALFDPPKAAPLYHLARAIPCRKGKGSCA